jgi:hypothetical protein
VISQWLDDDASSFYYYDDSVAIGPVWDQSLPRAAPMSTLLLLLPGKEEDIVTAPFAFSNILDWFVFAPVMIVVAVVDAVVALVAVVVVVVFDRLVNETSPALPDTMSFWLEDEKHLW